MNLVNDVVLVTRNARDKVQVARFQLYQDRNNYIIQRFTGQYGGKTTEQPEKVIEKGKAKRSVLMQAELEFNSLIKKSMDKGYKKLSNLTKTKFDVISKEELDSVVPTIKTDTNGNIKPQLAKSSNDCSINVFEKPMFVSRKLDGVRCLMKYDEDREEIISVSRGGGEYDVPTEHIRTNPTLIKIFEENPGLILDCEIYVNGWSLQKISGTARLKTHEDRCNTLEYWIYDIADDSKILEDRLDLLIDFKIIFDEIENSKIKVLEHILVTGWSSIKKYHDKFVSEGFEGLVARKTEKKYSPGKRNSDWIKVKDYQDDEFEITGIEEGLRDEDMCFTLLAKNGKPFKAKPIGKIT